MVQTLAGCAGRKALMEVNLLAARSLGLSAGDLASLVEERREGSRLQSHSQTPPLSAGPSKSWAALEDQLANMPGVWWPEVDMVERLETACSLVIIHLATTVFSPSPTFIINNLLLLFSKVIESQPDSLI